MAASLASLLVPGVAAGVRIVFRVRVGLRSSPDGWVISDSHMCTSPTTGRPLESGMRSSTITMRVSSSDVTLNQTMYGPSPLEDEMKSSVRSRRIALVAK